MLFGVDDCLMTSVLFKIHDISDTIHPCLFNIVLLSTCTCCAIIDESRLFPQYSPCEFLPGFVIIAVNYFWEREILAHYGRIISQSYIMYTCTCTRYSKGFNSRFHYRIFDWWVTSFPILQPHLQLDLNALIVVLNCRLGL